MSEHLLTDQAGPVGVVSLNRAQALNALSLEMIRGLNAALSSWLQDSHIQAALIESVSPKAFCAGGDLRFFYEIFCNAGMANSPLLEAFFTEEYTLNHLIHHYHKPYIALLNGLVMGGGMGISQSSSPLRLRIVTEQTRMAMPEVNIGLFPDVGGSYFLSRMPGETGTWLALTGETIGAADALHTGLADIFVPSDTLPALRDMLQARDTDHIHAARHFCAPFEEKVDTNSGTLARHRQLIDKHFSLDSVQDIMHSLADGADPFARHTAETMRRRSPLLLCVTLEQLRRGRTMTIAECLRMERTMMHHCFEHPDAMEGIRAAIIDKDNRPQWQPATIEEVSEDMVQRFFAPVWRDETHPLRGLA
ncbi:enoyl-CoA hydratase/isomerase family protein [Oxalicibacterium solurbis]|uniref:3-hydroxyisobutyryl-CoA hydrolase n=1 Tax=Oxalicibacterium solurbis TaxID=69280 RepID=A0A8J3F6G3_9BURK|nr:enoyl-CoA hydratase/isomerase family protein [Oxalicibacterium solurbis]GGI54808.1 3-hydroxyisobutyryl-CoA hydrolase [Oxalicibacterium solurbis]